MADVKYLVYFTCFCLYQDLVFCDEYGESGNKITLSPVIRKTPEEILWTHNGNKVLEYDGRQMETYGSFKDRVELDFVTGELTIRKLNNQDSGTYQSEIWINKNVHTSSHILTVLDALPEPLVTCEVNETSNVKKLSCSVESQTEPSYEWSGSDVKQPGPTLVVNEQEENPNSVYTCTVRNKAGSRTTDFNLQDCATGRANLAVLAPVLIVILLLIILLAFYFYRRKRQQSRKLELKNKDPETGEKKSLLEDELEKEEENKQTDNLKTAEGELEKNWKNSENADVENAYVKADKTNTKVEIQKPIQTQKEKKIQILKYESEDREKTPEEQNQTRGEQDTKDGIKIENEDRKNIPEKPTVTPREQGTEDGDKIESEVREKTLVEQNQTRGEQGTKDGDKNESEVREKTPEEQNQTRGEPGTKDGDTNESENREKTPEEQNQTRGEQDTKDGDTNESEVREKTPEEQNQTRGEPGTKDGDTNEEDHTPEEKKEKEDENKEKDNTNKGISNPEYGIRK